MRESEMGFRATIRQELGELAGRMARQVPAGESLAIDLHCHDANSDLTDLRLGRMLRLPETWTPTDEVVATLRHRGMEAVTLTNHNNARSCWDLLERGIDVLPGAELTCRVPDYGVWIHVLTYGFTPAEEEILVGLRTDLYRFLDYAAAQDLVTVLAHPLFFGGATPSPPIDLLEKLSLLFESFEAWNGQRDGWQNLLVGAWVEALDEERIDALSRKHGVRPGAFCRRPYAKGVTGGSDCHMAMFAGTTFTRVGVRDLERRLLKEDRSALVLEGLREGTYVPQGSAAGEEKLAASVLDYFCQAVMNMEDPGLVRMLLHQGTAEDKLAALTIHNLIMELRRHRYTMRFLRAYHESLQGRRPGFMMRRRTTRPFRPLLRALDGIAAARRERPGHLDAELSRALPAMFHQLVAVLAQRLEAKVSANEELARGTPASVGAVIQRLEVPADLRALLAGKTSGARADMSLVDLSRWSDGLSFPFLGALAIGGLTFASSQAQHSGRQLVDDVARALGRFDHPHRALWLTDTLFDGNEIASGLRSLLAEVEARDLPIDFAVVGARRDASPHVKVLEPLAELSTPFQQDRPVRLFDILELHSLFAEGGYDRVVCSTELPMGPAALCLKHAFNVKASFYVHADWMDYARRVLGFDQATLDRVRRLLRALYREFDGLFVPGSGLADWLTGRAMGIPHERVHRTSCWASPAYRPWPVAREDVIPGLPPEARVLVCSGPLREEEGVLDLPVVLRRVREAQPAARLVVVGEGPCRAALAAAVPDGHFLGRLEPEALARVYSAGDLLLVPSTRAVPAAATVEAMACGLPVIARASGASKDLLIDGECGLVAAGALEMGESALRALSETRLARAMSRAAMERASVFAVDRVLGDLLGGLGLGAPARRAPAQMRPFVHATGTAV